MRPRDFVLHKLNIPIILLVKFCWLMGSVGGWIRVLGVVRGLKRRKNCLGWALFYPIGEINSPFKTPLAALPNG